MTKPILIKFVWILGRAKRNRESIRMSMWQRSREDVTVKMSTFHKNHLPSIL